MFSSLKIKKFIGSKKIHNPSIRKIISNKKFIGGIFFCVISYIIYNYIPFAHDDFYIKAIQEGNLSLKSVPRYAQTQQLYDKIIHINPSKIDDVPDKFRTNKMYEYLVSQNVSFLQHIPKKFLTQAIYDIAVCRDPSIFHSTQIQIPEEFRTNILSTRSDKEKHRVQLIWNIKSQTEDIKSFYTYIPGYYPEGEWFAKKWPTDIFYAFVPPQYINKKSQTDTFNDIYEYLAEHDILHTIPYSILQELKSDLNNFRGLVLTGEQYNKYFSDIEAVKIIKSNGLGVDDDHGDFNPLIDGTRGLHFIESKLIPTFGKYHYPYTVFMIRIPSSAIVKIVWNRLKTSHLIRCE